MLESELDKFAYAQNCLVVTLPTKADQVKGMGMEVRKLCREVWLAGWYMRGMVMFCVGFVVGIFLCLGVLLHELYGMDLSTFCHVVGVPGKESKAGESGNKVADQVGYFFGFPLVSEPGKYRNSHNAYQYNGGYQRVNSMFYFGN